MTLPAVDLDYDLSEDIVPGPWRRDSLFVFARIEEAVREAVGPAPSLPPAGDGRRPTTPAQLLDVACGTADQAGRLGSAGWQSWGLEPSPAMLRLARLRRQERGQEVIFLRGIAERLPFADSSLDCVVCQGSLDHFARPEEFMAEVARILKPEGRAVIALANFESLSCRLGRLVHRFRRRFGIPEMPGRPYWQIPENHTFKGDADVLRRLAQPWLRLERMHGVSLLWLLRRWSLFLESLPEPAAWALLRSVDRLAYRVPSLSDTLISVWRPRKKALLGGQRLDNS